MKKLIFSAIVSLVILRCAVAQTPAPVILQAATTPVAAAAAPKSQAASDAPDLKSLLGLVEEMQTANAQMLQKQQATLQALDELQKAAEEIKSYGKRS